MTTRENELKACPFCAASASLHRCETIFAGQTYPNYPGQEHGFRIECRGKCHSMTCWWHTIDEAVTAWNTRASAPAGVREAAWKIAAQTCEDHALSDPCDDTSEEYDQGYTDGCNRCAEQIRSLWVYESDSDITALSTPVPSEWNAAVEACKQRSHRKLDDVLFEQMLSRRVGLLNGDKSAQLCIRDALFDYFIGLTKDQEQASAMVKDFLDTIYLQFVSLHRREAQRTDGLEPTGESHTGACEPASAAIRHGSPSDYTVPRWRHKKRGTFYTEIGRGPLQASTRQPVEGDVIVCYQGNDGRFFHCEATEFEDGRFERVTAPQTDGGEE